MKDEELRIVSLLPSATEILAALNLTSVIVGRSHECDYPPEIMDLPICTGAKLNTNQSSAEIDTEVQKLLQAALSIYEINIEVIKQLKPTHIVTQDQCDVCAVTFADVTKAVATLAQPQPEIISLQPHTLADVWGDITRVGTKLGIDSQPTLSKIQQQVEEYQQRSQQLLVKPRVATLEWLDPLMGSGNWIPELVELAGGEDIFGTKGKPSVYLSWEDLLTADPDVIIVMCCGFDLERTKAEITAIMDINPNWQKLRAVNSDRLYITDGNAYFNRPGPRLVESIEILAEILHTDWFNPKHREIAWKRLN